MPLIPGKCPSVDGVPNCPPFSEQDCIEVFKIYDHCAGEDLLGKCLLACSMCTETLPADAVITCTVVEDSARCFHIGYGSFNPPFYRPILVHNQVNVQITIKDTEDNILCRPFTTKLEGIFQTQMWAPEGTLVQCSVVDVGVSSCEIANDPISGAQLICCQASICREIQVKALVRLLVPSYGFCEMDTCTPVPQPSPCPPENTPFPPQRCQQVPSITILDIGDTPLEDVAISVNRAGTTTTAITDASGIATFTTLGALIASDIIQFMDSASNDLISFTMPYTFTDSENVSYDCNTVCTMQFTRVEGVTFDIFIDGIQNGTINP